MRNVSNAFKNELYNGNRNYVESCKITFIDGTSEDVTNANIWSGGFKIEDSVSSSGNFDIGAVIVNQFVLILNNIYDDYSEYDFDGAEISNVKVGLNLPNGTTESVSFGTYTVSEAKYNGSIITLTCVDNMSKFDRPYSDSNLTYPATLGAIVRDACNVCDVSLTSNSATFENDDFVVSKRPDGDTTFREVLSWVGQISCHWLKCNVSGQLTLGWYDREFYDAIGNYDAKTFSDPASNTVDAGSFSNPATDAIDAGSFSDAKKYHHIYSTISTDMSTDDVIITGIRVSEEPPEESENQDPIIYQAGEDGYVLGVENNWLIQDGKGAEVAQYLGTRLIGLRFRPLTLTCISDPTIEAGDIALFTDRKGRTYKTLITRTTLQAKNYQTISCDAQTPKQNRASRSSKYTQVYQKLKNELSRQKSAWEMAIEDLDNRLSNSSGLYSTIEQQEDGSNIYYLHDKPTLEESEIVWKMTAEAWGVSTNGGETWNGGMTVDGDVIARILTSIGVNADWINTGALVIQDSDGNIMFRGDVDTGIVDIVANTLSIRGKTVEEIAQDNLSDYVNEVFDPTIANIQNQIDGQIETWFYNYVPTNDNAPASEWTTDAEKDKHLGDLFYIVDNDELGGAGYRYALIGGVYGWQEIEDTQTLKALSDAAKAQDTADNKRRVFISTPVPPYDSGDLWWTSTSNGAATIKVCTTSRQSGTYVSADWIDNKYVGQDDVDSAITEYDTSLGQTEVFNKLTNGGSDQGIYIQNGKVYVNASYILAGTLAGQRINGKGLYVYDNSGNTTLGIDSNGNVTIRANTFSLQGSTIQNIANNAANTAANNALNSAKEYTDSQLAGFDPGGGDVTIEDIYNALSNNGSQDGLWVSGGQIYFNATYIDTGNLAGWTVDRYNRTLSCNGYGANISLNASSGTISVSGGSYGTTIDNWGVDSGYITGGTVEAEKYFFVGDIFDVNDTTNSITFYGGKIAMSTTAITFGTTMFVNFYKPPRLYNLTHVNSGGHLVFESDGATLAYLSSSSKRYKDNIRKISDEEAEKILNIPIVWFKYKDGYLSENDRFVGKPMQGMYAEDVYENIPEAVQLNEDGTVEDWNYRILIPLMIKDAQIKDKKIKEQLKEIETLKSNQEKILQALSKAGIEVEL